jgi:DNA ligase-associated metallophosphoesterase
MAGAHAAAAAVALRAGGCRFELQAERAAWLPEAAALLVADVHLGKAQAFRRLGVPVPSGTTEGNLARLDRLIARTAPRTLVFLGDLLHARAARSEALLAAVERWRRRHHALAMLLVRGNHDSRAGDPPPEWGIEVVDEPWVCGGLALRHEPATVAGRYVVAGHVHPAFVVGRGADVLRLPCFHFGPRLALLPAFGEFTGMHRVRHGPQDRVFVVADGQVREVPGEVPGEGAEPTLAG